MFSSLRSRTTPRSYIWTKNMERRRNLGTRIVNSLFTLG